MLEGDTVFDDASMFADRMLEDVDYRYTARHYRTGTAEGVRVVCYDVARSGSFGVHIDHGIHQFTWFDGAALGIFLGDEILTLPPDRAMWIPAGTVHDVAAYGPGRMYCVYLRTAPGSDDFTAPRAFDMSELLRGLVKHLAADIGESAGLRARAVLLDALAESSMHDVNPMLAAHPAARAIAERIVAAPAQRVPLSRLADEFGVSARTIRRRFLLETGMPYRKWALHARLAISADVLPRAASIGEVAAHIGFSNTSGFISAFKRRFGCTPGQYRARKRSEQGRVDVGEHRA